MQIINVIFLLFGGVLMLWKSGDYAVQSMLRIASLFGLTTLFSGFVLMAISTGIPELAIVVNAIKTGAPALSVGDILGSNVIDITLVLGIAALMGNGIIVRDKNRANIMLLHTITMLVMVAIFLFGKLTWIHGLGLVVTYFCCLIIMWQTKSVVHADVEHIHGGKVGKNSEHRPVQEKVVAIAKFIGSMVVVMISSRLIVLASIDLAHALGLPLEVVGATVVALGTSLPELSLSMHAVAKKKYSLALGNSLGSVLEQGTLILGLLAFGAGKPIDIVPLRSLAPFMFAAFGLISWAVVSQKKISKLVGGVLMGIFFVYTIYQFFI